MVSTTAAAAMRGAMQVGASSCSNSCTSIIIPLIADEPTVMNQHRLKSTAHVLPARLCTVPSSLTSST